MTQEHPITPPPELVQQWHTEAGNQPFHVYIATQAARWGADQELEACCSQLAYMGVHGYNKLYEARRPEPPSLKEQALAALDEAVMRGDCITVSDALRPIRRALEALDD